MIKAKVDKRLADLKQVPLFIVILILEDLNRVSDFDKGAKLCAIVFYKQSSILYSYVRVNSGDRNIRDLHVCVDASADPKLTCLVKVEDMNDFSRSALNALHYKVVILRSLKVHDLKEAALHL